MGIDIRDGPQLECIQCALCIDACNDIMDKVGRPRGLVSYETFRNLEAPETGKRTGLRIVRPRTLLYLTLIGFVSAIFLWALTSRTVLDINVLHERNPLYVKLADGSIRNAYTVKILSKLYDERSYKLSIDGLPDASIKVLGMENMTEPVIEVPPDSLREVRTYVTVGKQGIDKLTANQTPFSFVIRDVANGETATRASNFRRGQ
jgi:polyferredoxin